MSIRVVSNPTRIMWSHFREVDSIPGTSEEAQINPQMSPMNNVSPMRTANGRFRLPNLTITVGLNMLETMVRRSATKTNELLQHEQGHYDLLILVCRVMARELESIEEASFQDLASRVQEVKSLHDARAESIDSEYDRQTDHHRNRPAQSRWDAAIAHAMRNPLASEVLGIAL